MITVPVVAKAADVLRRDCHPARRARAGLLGGGVVDDSDAEVGQALDVPRVWM
jgi:hypothetical protein